MAEIWIVAVNEDYYPSVQTFESGLEAQTAYDEALAELSSRSLSHTAIYLGQIERATHTRQKNMGWDPIKDGDPERDGYCEFCRSLHLPEGVWT